MRWFTHLLFTGLLLGQITLSEEDAISLSNNILHLQFQIDSLSKIVLYQEDLIDIYKTKSTADDSVIIMYGTQVDLLEDDNELLKKKVKLVKPSWYENKWLYFTYGAGIIGIPSYYVGKGIKLVK
ncbi:MAG: hypothetical protein H8E03_01480 [Pelagibacteraceae bacterium]|nr:hypothetical protein [Pelagibacteraceae bacterium]